MDAITNRPDLRLDTPAGRIIARAEWDADAKRVRRVSFENVPSFVFLRDQVVEVPEVGQVRLDIAFGGAFYAYVDVAANGLGLHLDATDYRALIDIGMRIKRAVMEAIPIQHPTEADLGFLYGTIFYDSAPEPAHEPAESAERAHNSRNVCVFAEGEVDRSPTGTGVSGRLALEFAKGRLNVGEPFVVESILGTTFTGKVLRETPFGPHAAIIPEITGRAWITGRHEFVVVPDDPLNEGFILR
jgi:trans-L-3-hydroxyproline dehydratase